MLQLMINNGSLGVEPGLLFVIIKFLKKEVKNIKKKFLSITMREKFLWQTPRFYRAKR